MPRPPEPVYVFASPLLDRVLSMGAPMEEAGETGEVEVGDSGCKGEIGEAISMWVGLSGLRLRERKGSFPKTRFLPLREKEECESAGEGGTAEARWWWSMIMLVSSLHRSARVRLSAPVSTRGTEVCKVCEFKPPAPVVLFLMLLVSFKLDHLSRARPS